MRSINIVYTVLAILLYLPVDGVAEKSGSTSITPDWYALGSGLSNPPYFNGAVYTIAIVGEEVYAGGSFIDIGGDTTADYLVRWDGCSWHPVLPGLNGAVWTIEVSETNIYVGGEFTLPYEHIGFWNGSQWNELGGGLNSTVSTIAIAGSTIYAGGAFTDAGGNANGDHIARWDGNNWLALGQGLNNSVLDMEFDGSILYVGGLFTDAGNIPIADAIALWTGTEWASLGNEFEGYSVTHIELYGGVVYAAGFFTVTGGDPNESHFAYFDGSHWHSINTGPVEALLIYDQEMYVSYYTSDNAYVRIFHLDTQIWEDFPGAYFYTSVYAFAANGIDIYAGGNFTAPPYGQCPQCNIMRYGEPSENCSSPPPIDWIWARALSDDPERENEGVPHAFDIAIDGNSNSSYTVGYFYGTVDFDPGVNEYFISSLGALDGYVIKLTAEGDFAWAKQIGGPGSGVIADAIATDAFGNIFITGAFSGGVDFDPGPGVNTVYSLGESDVFILKLNATGQFEWVRQFGYFVATCWGTSIAVDRTSGNIYTTGTHSGQCDFNPGNGSFILGSQDQEYNIFISKLDSLGNFNWAREVQGVSVSDLTQGTSIALDALNENVYTAGQFYGTCDFDTGPGIDSLTSNGDADIFLLKLDSAGNYIWVNQIGGGMTDYSPSIALGKSSDEKVYLSGAFTGTVDFDPGPSVVNLTGNGELFICKLDSAGQLVWARALGGSAGVNSYSGSYLSVDTLRNENVHLYGSFYNTADFDPGPLAYTVTAIGQADVFVAKLDSAGSFLLAKTAGGIASDIGIAGDIDTEGKIVMTGNYTSVSLPFDNDTLLNIGGQDVFIAKAGGCTTLVTSSADNGPGTLRDVIACAQINDRIEFALPPMSQITLTTGEIIIDKPLTIAGPGLNELVISGNNNSRIFNLFPGVRLRIDNLTMKDALASINGGAIYVRGMLHLENILLENNFQNNVPKSITLVSPGSLQNQGLVEMRF